MRLILLFVLCMPALAMAWPVEFFDGSEIESTTADPVYCPDTPENCKDTYSPHFEDSRYQRASEGIWTMPKYMEVDPSTSPYPSATTVTKIVWYYRTDPQNCPVHDSIDDAPEFHSTVGDFGVAEARPGIFYAEDGCEYLLESQWYIGANEGVEDYAVGTGNFNPGGESEKYFIGELDVVRERLEDAPNERYHDAAYVNEYAHPNYPTVSIDWDSALGLGDGYEVHAANVSHTPLESGTCSDGDTYYQFFGVPYCLDTDQVNIGLPPGSTQEEWDNSPLTGPLSDHSSVQSNLRTTLNNTPGTEKVADIGGGGSEVTEEVDTQNSYSRFYNITYIESSDGFDGAPDEPDEPSDPDDPSDPGDGGDGGSGSDGEDDSGSATVACGLPFECSGDPIQCAGLKFQHENSCSSQEAAEDFVDSIPEKTSGVGDLGDPDLQLAEEMPEIDVADEMGNWTDVDSGYVGECPEPRVLELGLGNFEISWQPFCEFAETIRPFTIFMFTFLGATAIGRTLIA